MKTSDISLGSLRAQLTAIIAQLFRLEIDPEDFAAAELRMDERLELDSIDRVELIICIEESFGIAMGRGQEARQAFSSIASLAEYIHMHSAAGVNAAISPEPVARSAAPRREPFSFAQIFTGP